MNTDKLLELERKWRGMNCRTEAQDRVYRVCADELAALRAEQAVGEEQRARELLAEEVAAMPRTYEACDYQDEYEAAALRAIRRALGTARQSEGVVLVSFAEGRISHINRGLCPDAIEGYESRDPECAVCAAMLAAAPGGEGEGRA